MPAYGDFLVVWGEEPGWGEGVMFCLRDLEVDWFGEEEVYPVTQVFEKGNCVYETGGGGEEEEGGNAVGDLEGLFVG